MKWYHLAITVLVMVCALAVDVSAAGMTAYDIVKKSEDLLDQAKDSRTDMLMVLINKKGEKRERTLNAFVKRSGDGTSKSIVFFKTPADVKGTSFLVWTD